MKKLILLFLLISTFANAQIQMAEDYSFKSDKKLHVATAIVISTGVFHAVNAKTNDIDLACRAAIFSATIGGFGKESFDILRGKEGSIADFTYTAASAVVNGLLLRAITKHRKKKKAKRERLFQMALNDLN